MKIWKKSDKKKLFTHFVSRKQQKETKIHLKE